MVGVTIAPPGLTGCSTPKAEARPTNPAATLHPILVHLQLHDVVAISALLQHPLAKVTHVAALEAQAHDAGLELVGPHLRGRGRIGSRVGLTGPPSDRPPSSCPWLSPAAVAGAAAATPTHHCLHPQAGAPLGRRGAHSCGGRGGRASAEAREGGAFKPRGPARHHAPRLSASGRDGIASFMAAAVMGRRGCRAPRSGRRGGRREGCDQLLACRVPCHW